jgi:hypothetical protein
MNFEKEYTLKNIKEYLKKIATYIKIAKQLRKTVYCNLNGFNKDDIEEADKYHLYNLKYNFRMFHIAECLFRGRTMQQIENKNEYDDPDYIPYDAQKILDKIKEAMEDKDEETLCVNS